MRYYAALFISFAGVVFGLANGIYAMASPSRWLRTRWTAKGLLPLNTTDGRTRLRALLFFMVAAVFADGGYQMLSSLFCLM